MIGNREPTHEDLIHRQDLPYCLELSLKIESCWKTEIMKSKDGATIRASE